MATFLISGPAGDLELAIDAPPAQTPLRALALIAHPHPLHGGTMDNKVVTTLARTCTGSGCLVVRFNYRGVGRSLGAFDHAKGETDDAMAALDHLTQHHLGDLSVLPVVLCGFSFGTAVVAQLAQRLPKERLCAMILAGAAVQRFTQASIAPELSLLIHGELDETVPLAETMDWAATQALSICVIPRADHFFNRQLLALKLLAARHLKALLPNQL